MFYGELRENHQKEILLLDIMSLDAFKAVLRYVYTGYLPMEGLSFELMLEILALSHKYQLQTFTESFAKAILPIAKP